MPQLLCFVELEDFLLDGCEALRCLLELVILARIRREVNNNFLEALNDGGLEYIDDLNYIFFGEKLREFEYNLQQVQALIVEGDNFGPCSDLVEELLSHVDWFLDLDDFTLGKCDAEPDRQIDISASG